MPVSLTEFDKSAGRLQHAVRQTNLVFCKEPL
jgi:hypothetical protein